MWINHEKAKIYLSNCLRSGAKIKYLLRYAIHASENASAAKPQSFNLHTHVRLHVCLLSMNVAKVRNENIQNQYEPSPISHQNAFASTVNENV